MRSFQHLVTLGGSITTGYASTDRKTRSWSSLVAQELARDGGPDFRWTNRGVSGTDSVSGAVRVTGHARGDDLVIVEQAINDQWLDPNVAPASYEGVLRQLLSMIPRPHVLCLLLSERGGAVSAASRIQETLAGYYGLTSVRPDFTDVSDAFGPDDAIHPIDAGHARIAECVLQALSAGLRDAPQDLPPPLFSTDWEHVDLWSSDRVKPRPESGWSAGGDVHGEWQVHGGAPVGWTTSDDEAHLVLEVSGTVIGVLISESEHYRNVEAWLDDGPHRILPGFRPDRVGYLGWSWHALSRQATAGPHLVHLRPAPEGHGSGRPVHVVAVLSAGAASVAELRPGRADAGGAEPWVAPGLLPLTNVGRLAPSQLPSYTLGWSLTSVAGVFTGERLHLALGPTQGRVVVRLTLDGRAQTYQLPEGDCTLMTGALGAGPHQFELVKLSEGLFGSTVLTALLREGPGTWLAPPAKPPLRIEVYGDSITAGACNLDLATDQYEDLATHDPTLTYVALAARRWNADVVAVAVSGTGVTCSWNPILLPDVFDRWLPDPRAELAPSDRMPDVVLVNLGTNDLGFPQSQGDDLSPDYARALVAFVQTLRERHPEAWIVGAFGGIFGPQEAVGLRAAWRKSWATLAASDPRVRSFEFQTSSPAHPRVEAHARMADELVYFLNQEIPL